MNVLSQKTLILPTYLNEFIKIEIIKQLKEDDKLGLIILPGEKKLFVDSSSRLSSITRWYNGHNREASITYLEELTEKIEK